MNSKNKKCSACGRIKSFSEFYSVKSKYYKDGLDFYCKLCRKKQANDFAKTEKGRLINHRSADKYRTTEKGKLAKVRGCRKYRQAHKVQAGQQYRIWAKRSPDKIIAKNAIHYLIQKGTLLPAKKLLCCICTRPASDYHHPKGYIGKNKLNILALCRRCHYEQHKKVMLKKAV